MKRPNRLIYWSIVFFVSWALLFTSADYVSCQTADPDEFLDIAFGCQNDNSSVLELSGIIYSAFPCFLNALQLKRSEFLAVSLRC